MPDTFLPVQHQFQWYSEPPQVLTRHLQQCSKCHKQTLEYSHIFCWRQWEWQKKPNNDRTVSKKPSVKYTCLCELLLVAACRVQVVTFNYMWMLYGDIFQFPQGVSLSPKAISELADESLFDDRSENGFALGCSLLLKTIKYKHLCIPISSNQSDSYRSHTALCL